MDFSIKKVLYSEKLRRCWNEASLCFSITTTLQVCKIGILLIMDPTFHCKMTPTGRCVGAGDGVAAQKQTIVKVGREHGVGCAKLSETIERWTSSAFLTMNGPRREKREKKRS